MFVKPKNGYFRSSSYSREIKHVLSSLRNGYSFRDEQSSNSMHVTILLYSFANVESHDVESLISLNRIIL